MHDVNNFNKFYFRVDGFFNFYTRDSNSELAHWKLSAKVRFRELFYHSIDQNQFKFYWICSLHLIASSEKGLHDFIQTHFQTKKKPIVKITILAFIITYGCRCFKFWILFVTARALSSHGVCNLFLYHLNLASADVYFSCTYEFLTTLRSWKRFANNVSMGEKMKGMKKVSSHPEIAVELKCHWNDGFSAW